MKIDKNKSVCVSGHREIKGDFDLLTLYNKLDSLADNFSVFLVGMALGFDTLCFKCLEKIREHKSIKIIACVPCLEQDKKFSKEQKNEYDKMLKSADCVEIISKKYTVNCMMKRNIFMVDNSSYLLAYLYKNRGGTYNTVEYAKRQNITIEYI